jgi:TatD DNase family protein
MLFDSHTHLNLAAFDLDRDTIIKRYLKKGVFLVNVGTCYQTSKKTIEIAETYKNCWASVGLHPAHTFFAPISQLDKNEINNIRNNLEETLPPEEFESHFEDLLKTSKKIVAIGECGLDYSYLKDFPSEKQEEYKKLEEREFRKQIKIAQKYDLPLILHLRDLYQEALRILKENNYSGKAVFHFFTGSLEDLKLILGNSQYFIGFSGVITYGNKLDEVIRGVPLERILIETDAPYVAPIPYRGKRNEPLYVKEVAKKIAEIKKLPLEEIEKQTFQNALRFFNIQNLKSEPTFSESS